MDYLFENLGDERFQEFCNCIVAKEFPNSQSFPVGQPDGGRDSLVYLMNFPNKEFIVFQVKYVRNPNSIQDVHKWLIGIIEDEAPKIATLIPKGAKQFYLLTNVKGTAHLDSGSKDKVNKILETNITIPSLCWWRDDLARLIEKDPIFKWSFPEILNGQDILNHTIFQNINENKERREAILRAYLADQYAIDNEVKFRQIDLQNKLLDLFTDVPIRIKKFNEKNRKIKRVLDFFESYNRKIVSYEDSFVLEEGDNVGAAGFLLHPKVQNDIERILLEGGPGQGKSTISQYICQVHRARLLNKVYEINQLPENTKATPVRLPFKIDLRHIAQWVENKNPYQGRINEEYFSSIWKNSLESFLVGHIVYHSQIDEFNSSDLIALTKLSSVLFVFDGFDEIANFNVRKEVIDFINKGINRLSENIKSIQVVITSRPAAFSDSIGFSIDEYPHFELTDITPTITKNYVEKWIKASKLDSREANELRRLVTEKMELPHLKDLAKSPMQLAIFISLLRTRGESLPNKRTALYDSYIDLFFNRESEKNTMIRDHRDLIIDIHQYLAWILHSEAELLKNSGSIFIDDLKTRLKTYLKKEGHKTEIADQLFHVMKERVCALVSRTQGTYEFEVQPLREYFCAKYLYNTAPYSPLGAEKKGTKPDRFDAIARNFYWHNVARFFSGCFDKGELPMLIHKLKELQNDDNLRYTNYPRLITSQILSDWVFTQYPLLLHDVVKIIVDGINIGKIINQESRRTSNEPLLLPIECGRLEVINECFEQLKNFPPNDYASELIGIIKNNPYQTLEKWIEYLPNIDGKKLTRWLEYAYMLEIIHKVEDSVLREIAKKDDILQKVKRIQILINGNKQDVIEKDINLKEITFNAILQSEIFIPSRRITYSSLQFLTFVTHPYTLSSLICDSNSGIPLINYLTHRLNYHGIENTQPKLISDFEVNDDIDNLIKQFAEKILPALNLKTELWKDTIEPWDLIVESLRFSFNDNWSGHLIAIIAAGIKSKNEVYEEFDDLDDDSKSLCKRTRCARMKSGNIKYWETQLSKSSINILFKLLTLFTWATPKCIISLFDPLTKILNSLSSVDLLRIVNGLRKTTRNSYFNNSQKNEIQTHLKFKPNSNNLKLVLSLRFSDDDRKKFIYDNFDLNSCIFDEVISLRLDYLIDKYIERPNDLPLLNELKLTYTKCKYYDKRYLYYERHRKVVTEIPIDIAKQIMANSKEYPRIIASYAERSCRIFANKNIKAVGKIAQEEQWFEIITDALAYENIL